MSTTIRGVRRLVLAVVVILLAFSASGVLSLAEVEPCTAGEPAGRDDGACAPTCVTCGCCVLAVEPAAASASTMLNLPSTDQSLALIPPRAAEPRDVLHVPKRARA
jgi:hypothetical protein